MNVSNCRICGRLFNPISGEVICANCSKKLEEKFQEVKVYINEHPRASIDTIAKDNDVTVKQIKAWVRQERLSFTDDSPVGVDCENCGKMIRSGRLCETCKASLASTLRTMMNASGKTTGTTVQKIDTTKNRMRFLDK